MSANTLFSNVVACKPHDDGLQCSPRSREEIGVMTALALCQYAKGRALVGPVRLVETLCRVFPVTQARV